MLRITRGCFQNFKIWKIHENKFNPVKFVFIVVLKREEAERLSNNLKLKWNIIALLFYTGEIKKRKIEKF